MYFVDRDRRAQRVPFTATRHPLSVAPRVGGQIRDDGRVVGPQLHLESVRIGLQVHLMMQVDDLVLVQVARTHAGNEDLPHARMTDALHDVSPAVPGVEIADHADALRIRSPHCEARAAAFGPALQMRAQLAVDVVMIAFTEQVKIQVGETHITGLMPQMLSAYSRMLRSLENGPMLSALITDLRVHSS